MIKKRYTLTFLATISASSDEKARKKAHEMKKKMNKNFINSNSDIIDIYNVNGLREVVDISDPREEVPF